MKWKMAWLKSSKHVKYQASFKLKALYVRFHEKCKLLKINLLNAIVSKYSLYANFLTRYPNPTNPEATLCYALNKLSEEARQ
jgi:hypothetical protein